MKKILYILGLCIAGGMFMTSCKPDEGGIPSFIEVTAFKVEDTPGNSVSRYEGCFTSNINTVEITVENSTESNLIGVFELPCRVPVLCEGEYDVVLKPAIKLNGISGTRSSYPFYTDAVVKKVNFVPDSVITLDTQAVHYTNYTRFAWEEYCENWVVNPFLPVGDTAVHIVKDKDTVRSDAGCAAIYMSPSQDSLVFTLKDSCIVNINDALILEMDYWTNVPLEIGMQSKYSSGSTEATYYAISLYPNQGWQKIYIQLGRLWSNAFNYYNTFKLVFRVTNPDGIEAKTYMDNFKLTAYKE